jgi:hypothetical protein
MWSRACKNYDTKLSQTVKQILFVFWWPPTKPPGNPLSLSQGFLVMIRVVWSLLGDWAQSCWWLWMAVSNRNQFQWLLLQWWVVAVVSSACSQGQYDQPCLHAQTWSGLWTVATVQGLPMICQLCDVSQSISTIMCLYLLPVTTCDH